MANRPQDSEHEEILQMFVAEARDILDDMEPHLTELEKADAGASDGYAEILNTVLRLFHSLKGSAGFLELDTIAEVTHEAENLLDFFRKGKAEITPDHIDLLYRGCDLVRQVLDEVEQGDGDQGYAKEAQEIISDFKESMARMADAVPPSFDEMGTARAGEQSPEIEAPVEEQGKKRGKEEAAKENVSGSGPAITPELVESFVQESCELLDEAEASLLEWGKIPGDLDKVANALGALRRFEENAGSIGQADLKQVSHEGESLLGQIREGALRADQEAVSVLLASVGALRDGVAQVALGGDGKIPGKLGLIECLRKIKAGLKGQPLREPVSASIQEPQRVSISEEELAGEQKARSKEKRSGISQAKTTVGERVPVPREGSVQYQTVRVDVQKLDALLDLVGELVMAEAMVSQNPDVKELEVPLPRFEKSVVQLDKITRELRDVSTSIRLIPLARTFRKMIRLVRDLSSKAHKHAELEVLGEETKVDKSIIELINDPLVHTIRNAIDHGIEMPEERETMGKSPVGHIALEAKHASGEVWITVRDDGKGLDREKILAKARERGLVNGNASAMRDEDVWELIFEPGFSTADQVTDISGRGVGMDVVKRNLEQIRGRVNVQSVPGRGTTFHFRIPLTLGIIEGMIARVGRARYTIPVTAIRESIQVAATHICTLMDGQEVIRNREELLPVVRLHKMHRVQDAQTDLTQGIVIVAESQGKTVGLLVDELLGQQQIVIKGLPLYLGTLQGISGCAILGDGEVSLILDIASLIKAR